MHWNSSHILNHSLVDLRPEDLQLLLGILKRYVPRCIVHVFGSRVNGRAKPTSDLDLAVAGDAPLSSVSMTQLQEAFSESKLPMKVDIVDYEHISDSFRNIIDEQKVRIQ